MILAFTMVTSWRASRSPRQSFYRRTNFNPRQACAPSRNRLAEARPRRARYSQESRLGHGGERHSLGNSENRPQPHQSRRMRIKTMTSIAKAKTPNRPETSSDLAFAATVIDPSAPAIRPVSCAKNFNSYLLIICLRVGCLPAMRALAHGARSAHVFAQSRDLNSTHAKQDKWPHRYLALLLKGFVHPAPQRRKTGTQSLNAGISAHWL